MLNLLLDRVALSSVVFLTACSLPLPWNLQRCDSHEQCSRSKTGYEQDCIDHVCVESICAAKDIVSQNRPGSIPIGVLIPEVCEESIFEAIRFAANSIPDPGRFEWHRCRIVNRTTDAENAFKILVNEHHVAAVIGPTTSTDALKVLSLSNINKYDTPIISEAATAYGIPKNDNLGLFYRTVPNDVCESIALAKIVSSGKSGFVYLNDDLGKSYYQKFDEAWRKEKGSMNPFVPIRVDVNPFDENNWSPSVNDIADMLQNNLVNNVIIVARPDQTIKILDKLANWSKAPSIYLTSSGKAAVISNWVQQNKRQLDWVIHVVALPMAQESTLAARLFYDSFSMTHPAQGAYLPFAYDAVYAVTIAVGPPSNLELYPLRAHIRKRLNLINGTGPGINATFDGWSDAVEMLKKDKAITLAGASGSMGFLKGERIGAFNYAEWISSCTPNGCSFVEQTPISMICP